MENYSTVSYILINVMSHNLYLIISCPMVLYVYHFDKVWFGQQEKDKTPNIHFSMFRFNNVFKDEQHKC